MSVSSGQGRIRRGPIAADILGQQFTQMGNQAARDRRLTRRARGLLVELLSHRDGYGISVPALVAAGPEGRDAIRTTLNELEQHGYLHRVQTRDGQGRIGDTVYEITDMPGATPETENGRSEPAPEKPAPGSPAPVNPPHKKTIPLQEDHWVEEELLSPPALPAQRPDPDPVQDSEREMLSPFEDPQQSEPLPGVDTYTAQLADADAATRVTASWVEAYKRSSSGSEPSAKAVSRVRASATSRLRAGKSVDELILIATDMAETNLTWTDLAEHEAHWLHKQQQDGLTGTDATVAGWLALSDQLGGRTGGTQPRPSVTDQRVQAALDLGRRMQAEADARRGGGYRPQSPNDAWRHLAAQAAAGSQPDGWESVPYCGHLDCDEITRMRQVDTGDGIKSPTYCSGCHPALQF